LCDVCFTVDYKATVRTVRSFTYHDESYLLAASFTHSQVTVVSREIRKQNEIIRSNAVS